jgi:dihydrofolate reductase
MINAIFAVDPHGGIGFKGSLPWPKQPEDLSWFKKHTDGQVVIMGRKTWDDPAMPKPLPNRISCIFTHRFINMPSVYCLVGDYQKQILKVAAEFPNRNIFIIGGSQLLEETLPLIETLYLTRTKEAYQTDRKVSINAYVQNLKLVSVTPGEHCIFSVYKK